MRGTALAAALLAALSTTACLRGCPSHQPPVHLNRSMFDQPKVKAQQESRFFYDGSAMRQPVPGTMAIEDLREDPVFFEGKNPDGSFVAKAPVETGDATLARGKERYGIYCKPCHDARGEGKGILFQRGNVPTASFLDDKIVQYPDGRIYDVITNGQGLMPSYRWPIPPADRWAIITYIRTLQARKTGG